MPTHRSAAEVVREYKPIDESPIHGVTFDGRLTWFARNDELCAFDPKTEKVVKRFAIPGAAAGTAFDGMHIYQLAGAEILVVDPEDGRVVRKIPAPSRGEDSGMAWGDGHLWVDQFRGAKIHKVDPKTGAIAKTLTSDRFVTGVSCVEGQLWHAASFDDKPAELRRIGSNGDVEEVLDVPVDGISGMERTPNDEFWCAGSKGQLRLVKRA